jgi:DNA polymerase III epsilon subunit family exonuclease
MSKIFVIVDLETTGLSPYKHAITEIAAVRFDGNEIIGEFQSLVDPERHIPSFITKLTGISNDMVEGSPTICEILPDFLKFLGDDIFVAHNARFDH